MILSTDSNLEASADRINALPTAVERLNAVLPTDPVRRIKALQLTLAAVEEGRRCGWQSDAALDAIEDLVYEAVEMDATFEWASRGRLFPGTLKEN